VVDETDSLDVNHKPKNFFLDLVISGPDMSGTSTQIGDLISYFRAQGKIVRDLRGTEEDALFHAEKFNNYNYSHFSLTDFLNDGQVSLAERKDYLFEARKFLGPDKMLIPSMCKNEVSTYINPDLADVWIMEEPTKRGAGMVNRTIELHRSKYDHYRSPETAAHTHHIYRIGELLRFRKPLRDQGKLIIRSRSEESACYQVYHPKDYADGMSLKLFHELEGNQLAFANPPTHLFVVCAPDSWTIDEFLALRKERSQGRLLDDHELDAKYQVLVNERYATSWLEELYKRGCKRPETTPPIIKRFNIYDSKEEIKSKMIKELEPVLEEYWRSKVVIS